MSIQVGRPGITLDDITDLLAAVVDGLALRSIGDPARDLTDHENKRTTLPRPSEKRSMPKSARLAATHATNGLTTDAMSRMDNALWD